MKKVKFVFAIHNHQPVGNFEFVSEDAYQRSYLPLVEVLKEHPWFKANLHYTGDLLKWLVKEHPEFIGTLREMVASGQVEILTGGFYEPILALLPDVDKIGQIKKLTAYIKEHLGQEATGMWLAERVWEPHLPGAITAAGVDYVVVDDFHFKMTGLRDGELTGYFLTEEQGAVLKVFPGSEKLRYILPFKEPEAAIQHLRELPDAGENTLAVMADDGEKFGVWPGTFHWCYEEGWFKRFAEALEDNRDWLETTTFGEYIKNEPPRGNVYLPTCSYMEMGEWSLPVGATREYDEFVEELKKQPNFDTRRLFIKGGFFRNFLSKYPESNTMHKRMLQVSRKVHRALETAGAKEGKPAKGGDKMLDELWQSQCNDAYWHGVFGGLYLPHLRDAVYRHLIKAEEAAEKMLAGKADADSVQVETADLDGDLAPEVMVTNPQMALLIDPAVGGSVYELDYRPISMNLMNNLARRKEAYHDKLAHACDNPGNPGGATTIHERIAVKEDGLCEMLHYDWYRRASLIDHFVGSGVDIAEFSRSAYDESGDFVLSRYDFKAKKAKDGAKVTLSRRGTVAGLPVSVEKVITTGPATAGFDADYTIKNEASEELTTTFGVEFNFSLLAGDAFDRYYDVPGHVLKARSFRSSGELNNVRGLKMVDEWMGYEIEMEFGSPAVLWRFPVETVSQSEAGFERVYQSSAVVPLWRISLNPGERWKAGIKLRVNRRKHT